MRIHILLITILCLLIVVMTFPLVFKMSSHMPGFFSTDEPYGALWSMWWQRYAFQNNTASSFCPFIAAPFGINFGSSTVSYPTWQLLGKGFSIMTNEIIANNIFILISFVLTAIIVYFLVYHLTKNRLAGFLSSVIYTFCPYHFARSWQHLAIAQVQWMPLFIFALLYLRENKSYKAVIFVAISYFLIACFELGYAYFMAVATVVFIIFTIFYYKRKSLRVIWLISLGIFLAFLFLSPQILKIIKSMLMGATTADLTSSMYKRPFEDLFAQSAKPLSYLLPSAQHPIFGKFTQYFVGDFLYGVSFTEHTLYLGWTTIALSFIAFRYWRRNKLKKMTEKENFAIGYFILLAIVAWLFSQPPWWKFGSIRIFLPSFFMYKILPMFRAYARFGIVVMLAMSVLAGFGLKFILEKFKTQKAKILITCLFSCLVLFEFWNYPPFKVIDLTKYPVVYDWLKEQNRDFVIAEYPLDVEGQDEMYKFYQTKHGKKMINGTIPGTPANKISHSIIKLSEPRTAGTLKWLGVEYVLVHINKYEDSGLIDVKEELNKIKHNSKLKFVKNFEDIDVYEIIATPVEPVITKGGAE